MWMGHNENEFDCESNVGESSYRTELAGPTKTGLNRSSDPLARLLNTSNVVND